MVASPPPTAESSTDTNLSNNLLETLLESRTAKAQGEASLAMAAKISAEEEMVRLSGDLRTATFRVRELERQVEALTSASRTASLKWELKLKSKEAQLSASLAAAKSSGVRAEEASRSVDDRAEERVAAARRQEREKVAIAVAEAAAERDVINSKIVDELQKRIHALTVELESARAAHVKSVTDGEVAIAKVRREAAEDVETARSEAAALRGKMLGTTALLRSALAPASSSPPDSSFGGDGAAPHFHRASGEGTQQETTFSGKEATTTDVVELSTHLNSLLGEMAAVKSQLVAHREALESSERSRAIGLKKIAELKQELTLSLVALYWSHRHATTADSSSQEKRIMSQWVEAHIGASQMLIPLSLDSLESSIAELKSNFTLWENRKNAPPSSPHTPPPKAFTDHTSTMPGRNEILKGLASIPLPLPEYSELCEAVGYVLEVASEEEFSGGGVAREVKEIPLSTSNPTPSKVVEVVHTLMDLSEELSEDAAEGLLALSSLAASCRADYDNSSSVLEPLPLLTPPPSSKDTVLPGEVHADTFLSFLAAPYGGILALLCGSVGRAGETDIKVGQYDHLGGNPHTPNSSRVLKPLSRESQALGAARTVVEFLALISRWSSAAEPVISILRASLSAYSPNKGVVSPAKSSSSSSSSSSNPRSSLPSHHRSLLELSREETVDAQWRAARADARAAAVNSAAAMAVTGALNYAEAWRSGCVRLGENVMDTCNSVISTQVRQKALEELVHSVHRDCLGLRGARLADAESGVESRRSLLAGLAHLRSNLGLMVTSMASYHSQAEKDRQAFSAAAQEALEGIGAREDALFEETTRLDREREEHKRDLVNRQKLLDAELDMKSKEVEGELTRKKIAAEETLARERKSVEEDLARERKSVEECLARERKSVEEDLARKKQAIEEELVVNRNSVEEELARDRRSLEYMRETFEGRKSALEEERRVIEDERRVVEEKRVNLERLIEEQRVLKSELDSVKASTESDLLARAALERRIKEAKSAAVSDFTAAAPLSSAPIISRPPVLPITPAAAAIIAKARHSFSFLPPSPSPHSHSLSLPTRSAPTPFHTAHGTNWGTSSSIAPPPQPPTPGGGGVYMARPGDVLGKR